MLEDLQTYLLHTGCDLLVIVDDCNTTGGFNASRREHNGKQKIEVLTTGATMAGNIDAPGWLTNLLTETLSNLLKSNPSGFRSSMLYSVDEP